MSFVIAFIGAFIGAVVGTGCALAGLYTYCAKRVWDNELSVLEDLVECSDKHIA